MLINPAQKIPGDGVAVLVHHHLVIVAGQPGAFHFHELGLHSRLIEPLGDARIEHAVIAGFAGNVQNGNVLEVGQFVRGFLREGPPASRR